MQPQNPTINLLLALLLTLSLGCADTPTEPELTEEEIRQIIAEELTKMRTNGEGLTPQEIAVISLKSTVVLKLKKTNGKWLKDATGFVVGEGLVATANHVIADMTVESYALVFGNPTTHAVTGIIEIDEFWDVAILAVPSLTTAPLPLGDSDSVQIGDTVYVTGNPDGYRGTFSSGIISGIRAPSLKSPGFQITAPVSPGSSGSCVLNSHGVVIGIVRGGDLDGQNLNFATPVNFLKQLLATIR